MQVSAARLTWTKAPVTAAQEVVLLTATPNGLTVSVNGRAVRPGGAASLSDLGRLRRARDGTVTITKPGFEFTVRQPVAGTLHGKPRYLPYLLL